MPIELRRTELKNKVKSVVPLHVALFVTHIGKNNSHRVKWSKIQCFSLALCMYPVSLATGTPTLLSEVLRKFPQSLQANSERAR